MSGIEVLVPEKLAKPATPTRMQAKARAGEIYRLVVRGLTTTEIAAQLAMPIRTVSWYLKEAARILEGDIKVLTREGILREMWVHHEERKRQLWLVVLGPKTPAIAKVAALKMLAEEDERLVQLAERLGILQQQPLKIEHMGEVMLRVLSEDDKRSLDAILRHSLERAHAGQSGALGVAASAN